MARPLSRRELLAAAAALPLARAMASPTVGDRPAAIGPQIGDPSPGVATLWAATDRPARLLAEWVTEEQPGEPVRVRGPLATYAVDLTARLRLTDLPPDATAIVSARFEDARTGALSDPVVGRFRTAPATRRDVRVAWSGDLAGQGWGIDPARGGYAIFDTIAARDPDLFLFTGDRIYADQPLSPEITLPDGSTWNNLVNPEVSEVAETIDGFRARYRYHLLDPAWRRFIASVPVVHQWDDHEVIDNWSPDAWLQDDRYLLRDAHTLYLRARQAWGDHTPMVPFPTDWSRIYRHVPYGPLLDVFVLDGRSYRTANNGNRQALPRAEAQLYGRPQLAWLKHALRRSRGLWKVILTGQPLSMLIWHDWAKRSGFDGLANGPGEPMGREHELDDLLRFLRQHDLGNVVFLSGDVHFTAAVHLHPDRATMKQFLPVWEFVTGPLHAGCFGPCELDPTFGPEIAFHKHAPPGQLGIGPWSDHQFFGEVSIRGESGTMTVRLLDRNGSLLHTQTLLPGQPR